jgi:hypothetical protein
MQHPLRCRCGTVSGWVKEPRSANRVVCYCKDCQAFAYFLGQENQILDERGGSEVIQILPKNLDSFGPVRAWGNTQGARGNPKPKASGVGRIILWFVSTVLKARINGSYRQTPLFLPDKGTPIVTPRVLSSAERAGLMAR